MLWSIRYPTQSTFLFILFWVVFKLFMYNFDFFAIKSSKISSFVVYIRLHSQNFVATHISCQLRLVSSGIQTILLWAIVSAVSQWSNVMHSGWLTFHYRYVTCYVSVRNCEPRLYWFGNIKLPYTMMWLLTRFKDSMSSRARWYQGDS